MSMPVTDGELRSLVDGVLSAANLAASVGFTMPTGESATHVLIQNLGTTNIRYRFTGDPTIAVGHILEPKEVQLHRGDLTNMRFILETGSPSLYYTFFTCKDKKP